LPAHLVSLGRVLLASLPADKRQAYLADSNFKPVTARTVTDPRQLGAILSRVNKEEYAWVGGELTPRSAELLYLCGILQDPSSQPSALMRSRER
jgi:DNA-binding IclR family transcriptional regulator